MATKKLPKKVCEALFEIDDDLNDAIANKDKIVILDVKTVITVMEYAKKFIIILQLIQDQLSNPQPRREIRNCLCSSLEIEIF